MGITTNTGLNPDGYLVKVDGLVPASSLHQKLVRQHAIVRAVPVAVEGDAAGLPVLVERLLETCRRSTTNTDWFDADV